MRRLLLDTHVALWALATPERLRDDLRIAIEDPKNEVYLSAASVWEVEIKRALGKLAAPDGFAAVCVERGFDELPISFRHAEAAGQLPPHHPDPFDRMLVAQATVEHLTLVSDDRAFVAYGVPLQAAG